MDTLMHELTLEDITVIEQIKAKHDEVATQLLGALPKSRELSIALTKLEEASMWAIQAVHVAGSN